MHRQKSEIDALTTNITAHFDVSGITVVTDTDTADGATHLISPYPADGLAPLIDDSATRGDPHVLEALVLTLVVVTLDVSSICCMGDRGSSEEKTDY